MKINLKSYKNVLMYANSLRVRAITDYIMIAKTDCNTDNLNQRINIKETEELFQDILIYDQDYIDATEQNEPRTKDIEKFKMSPVCGVGIDSICLSADGFYYPCSGWQALTLGNANEQSLQDVWNNSHEIKNLRTITNSSFPACVVCEARDYCSMCMVRNYNESNGDMFKINKHFCDVAFLNKKMLENYIALKQNNL